MVYDLILDKSKKKKIAVLIDPDKNERVSVLRTLEICSKCNIDFVMVGGSLVSSPIDDLVLEIKKNSKVPVVLFPGSILQISKNADAILLLSLISGRNPEYLIGNHIIAAPILKKINIEIIPTGYMLIESGKFTTVQYISNTTPIPCDKTDIAVATAIAGEMLGLKLIYLEAGSGAMQNVPDAMISAVKSNVSIPIVVGGGIGNKQQLENAFKAGADIIVIGNSLENKPEKLYQILK
jgi:putative glycerol-1-phosphate prenyltransferase